MVAKLCLVAAGFHRTWSTSPLGDSIRNGAELLKKANEPNNKSTEIRNNKANNKKNREQCNMGTPKSAL